LTSTASTHRIAFARDGQAASAEAFAQALGADGVRADTPATVLCDGDVGLLRLGHETLPAATLVLDWRHIAMRFGDHSPIGDALQSISGVTTLPCTCTIATDNARPARKPGDGTGQDGMS
jgi:hypothetical protein